MFKPTLENPGFSTENMSESQVEHTIEEILHNRKETIKKVRKIAAARAKQKVDGVTEGVIDSDVVCFLDGEKFVLESGDKVIIA